MLISNKTIIPTAQQRHTQPAMTTLEESPPMNVLCRINFEIDGLSQQLKVEEEDTLETITSELIEKLNDWDVKQSLEHGISPEEKQYLKSQIKNKLEAVVLANNQKSLQAVRWRNKLRQIIEERNGNANKGIHRLNTERSQQESKKNKTVKYFGYNVYQRQQDGEESSDKRDVNQWRQSQSQQLHGNNNNQRLIFDRMKSIQRQLNDERSTDQTKRQRLYDLAHKHQFIKQYISKMHNNQLLDQEISQCTFHPSIHQRPKQQKGDSQSDVFERLYNKAINKSQKMKNIKKQMAERQSEALKLYNFIPKINSCSREIIKAKKEISKSIYDSFFDAGLKETKKYDKISQNSRQDGAKQNIPREALSEAVFNHQETLNKKQKSSQKQKQQNTSSMNVQNNQQPHQHKLITSQSSFHLNKKPRQSISPNITNKNGHKVSQKILAEAQDKANFMKNKQKPSNKGAHKLKTQHFTIEEEEPHGPSRQELTFSAKKQKNTKKSANCLQGIDRPSFQNTKNNTRRARLNPHEFFEQQEALRTKKTYSETSEIHDISHRKSMASQNTHTKSHIEQQCPNEQNMGGLFSLIFSILRDASPLEDQISYNSIMNNKTLPQCMKKCLYPMAEEMKQLEVGLDQQQFVWSMSRIFQQLSAGEKEEISLWSVRIRGKRENKTLR